MNSERSEGVRERGVGPRTPGAGRDKDLRNGVSLVRRDMGEIQIWTILVFGRCYRFSLY